MNIDWTIKLADVAIVLATILGPILAVQIQKYLEKGREQIRRQAEVFNTLMVTRAAVISPRHVEALNAIPIQFYNVQSVISAWLSFLDHLNHGSDTANWLDKKHDLLADLLFQISRYLGYDFERVQLKNEVYFPTGHSEIDSDQTLIRKGLAGFLSGKVSLPMDVKTFPSDVNAMAEFATLRKMLIKWLEKNGVEQEPPVEIKA